jgi:ATP/maltotriose-dependent transcriptional regulator MalT
MAYTGIMLYIVPKGKVAYWSDWHLFGLSKTQYGDIHTTSMLTFLFFTLLHIYYNWKLIVSYLKDKTKKVSFTKAEFLTALGLNVLFVLGTLYMIQPFKAYLDLEDNIKGYWAKEYGEPPYGHAEETKLKMFCKKMGIDYTKASELLDKKGITYKANESLLNIAKENNTNPKAIFDIISKAQKSGTNKIDYSSIPSSLGRRTLEELSNMGKINLEKTMNLLHKKGLKDISKEDRVKNIADELGMMPIDLYGIITK